MADNVLKLSGGEASAFRNWVLGRYGIVASVRASGPTLHAYGIKLYREWEGEGKPDVRIGGKDMPDYGKALGETFKGSWLDPQEWSDEWKYQQFLASLYGDWLLGLGYRVATSFQKTGDRKWWETHGKPTTAKDYKTQPAGVGLAPGVAEKAATPPKTVAPPEDLTRQAIEQEGGYDVLVGYDKDGNRSVLEIIGRTDAGQMTEYQRQTLNAQRQKDYQERLSTQDWQRMLQERQSTMAGQQWGQQNAQDIMGMQRMADAFEQNRGAGLSDPSQWIKRYMSEREPNPYLEALKGLKMSPLEERGQALGESVMASASVGRREQAQTDYLAGLTPENQMQQFGQNQPYTGPLPTMTGGLDTRNQWLANQYEARLKDLNEETKATKERAKAADYVTNPEKYADLPLAQKQAMAALGKSVTQEGGYQTPTNWANMSPQQQEAWRSENISVKPTTPALPTWMSKMTGFGRVPTERTEIPTPSAQTWGQLPWSKREEFRGLVDVAGKSPFQDILDRMSVMLPQQQKAGSRTTPAWQR